MSVNYWLMKSEPSVFSIDDLKKIKKTLWDGVRNYQARNFMMNEMKVGDLVLFYHSNAEPPGIAGIAEVSSLSQPDLTAQDPQSPYFDPKSTPAKPIWFCVEISFKDKFPFLVSLPVLRGWPELKNMVLLKKGSRLSIQPVSKKEFQAIIDYGRRENKK